MRIKFVLLFFILFLQELKAQPFTISELKSFANLDISEFSDYIIKKRFTYSPDDRHTESTEGLLCMGFGKQENGNYYAIQKCIVNTINIIFVDIYSTLNYIDGRVYYDMTDRIEFLNMKKELINGGYTFKEVSDISGQKYFLYESAYYRIYLSEYFLVNVESFSIMLEKKR